MKLSALLREAARNVLSGTTRFVTYGVTFLLLAGGFIVADQSVVALEIQQANQFRDSGADVLIISATGQIDRSACLSLGHIRGVQDAGAMRESSRSIVLSVLPNAPVPVYEITPGFARLLDASDPVGRGIFLSQEVVQPLGVKAGGRIATSSGPVRVAATYTYPADGRRPGFGYAALAITSDEGRFDECWVKAWPQLANFRSILFTALAPGAASDDANDKASISQLNSSLGESFAGDVQFSRRVTQYGVPAILLVGLGLGFLAIWVRRLQFASALHSGIAKRDLAWLALMESVAWALPSAVISAVLAVALSQRFPLSDGMPLLFSELSVPLAGFCGIGLGALLAVALIRERSLLRFFRER